MREKVATLALLFFMALPAYAADVGTAAPPSAKKKAVKVAVEVHSTLAFTECVAKLLNNGLGAQEARQLCIDTVAN